MFHSNRLAGLYQRELDDRDREVISHLNQLWKADLVTVGWGPCDTTGVDDWHHWMTDEQKERTAALLQRCDETGESFEDLL